MKRDVAIAAAVFFLAVFTALLLFMHRLETGGDNLDYLQQARSIAQGEWGQALAWHRPPGYAACLAVLLQGAGIDFCGVLFSVPPFGFYLSGLFSVACFGFAAVLVRVWLGRLAVSAMVATGAAVLFSANQFLAVFSSVISAEYLLTALSLLVLWFWEGAPDRYRKGPRMWLAVLCAMLAASVKYQGLAIVAALFIWILLTQRRRAGLAAAGVLALFAAASLLHQYSINPQWLGRLATDQPFMTGEILTWKDRTVSYLATYLSFWTNLFVPKVVDARDVLELAGLRVLVWPVIIAVDLIAAVGLVQTVRRLGIRLSHLFAAVYAVLLFMWPDREERYLLPVAPFVFWFTLEGFWWLCSKVYAARPARAFPGLIAVLLVWSMATNVFAGVKNWRTIARLWDLPPWHPDRYVAAKEDDFADFMDAGMWIGALAPSNVVVFSRKALFTELASGRRSLYYSASPSPEALWAAMSRQAAVAPCYVLRDVFPMGESYGRGRAMLLEPVLAAYAERLRVIYRAPLGSEVIEVLSDRPGVR